MMWLKILEFLLQAHLKCLLAWPALSPPHLGFPKWIMSDRLVFEIFVLEKLGEKKGKTREQGWKKFLFLFRVGVGWEHNYHKKAEVEEENSDKKYVARTCLRNINNISGIFI